MEVMVMALLPCCPGLEGLASRGGCSSSASADDGPLVFPVEAFRLQQSILGDLLGARKRVPQLLDV